MKDNRKLSKVTAGPKSASLRPIENEFKAECLVRFEMRGRNASAFMLQTGDKGNESLRFIFAWDIKGVHTTLKPEQEDGIFDAIEAGLKDLPEQESLTVYMASFASDHKRQAELDQTIASAPNPQLKFLLMSDKKRTDELTWAKDGKGRKVARGLRKPKTLRVYCTYTIASATAEGNDFWERTLLQVQNTYFKFVGSAPEIQKQRFEIAFEKAFSDGFINWEQLLTTKMGLDITPLSEDDLWEDVWRRFNQTDPPQLPQLVVMREDGYEEQIRSETHFITRLIDTQTPFADRAWVNVNDKYIAPMVFADKPGGWTSKFNELSYLWQVMCREPVYDTEVFCQVTKANQGIVRENMRRVMKQSMLDQEVISKKGPSMDVAASLKQQKAVRAQEQLYEGAVALQTATVFLVHRKSLTKLDEACRYLENCFFQPARIEREREYAWKIWLQTLPICWETLLAKPFNRRLLFLTGEAPGMMPLVCPYPIDKGGFELVSEEGGVPIFINPFDQHRNMALFATTRAGKSVLIAGVLGHALARNIPTIIMDFPPSDAASTFKDWTHFLGGSYFDIGKECNNLMELPDLSSFDEKERRERMADYTDFLESALMTMIFGAGEGTTSDDRTFRQTLRSMIGPALRKFFDNPQISARYTAAIAAGLGTPEWDETPTMVDFLDYFRQHGTEDLSDDARNDQTTVRAVSHIERQLTFWVNSRVGTAISRPSTFKTDNQLLVFALRGLSDAEDASVLALSAYSAALRRTLSHRESVFFIDEFSVLMEWSQIGQLIARLCANGAKAGIRVFLAAQDPNTLLNSASGPKIIQNVSLRLIGRIQPVAIDSFRKFFGYDQEVISVNASERFYPQVTEMYSQWLVDDGNRTTYARFYPSPELLAVVANNPNETYCRSQFMKLHDSPYQAIVAFGRELVAALKNGRSLQPPELPPEAPMTVMPAVQPLSASEPTLATTNGSKPH
jgi:hypothetical protein